MEKTVPLTGQVEKTRLHTTFRMVQCKKSIGEKTASNHDLSFLMNQEMNLKLTEERPILQLILLGRRQFNSKIGRGKNVSTYERRF